MRGVPGSVPGASACDKAISSLGSNRECAMVAAITTAHGICQGSEPTKAAARVVHIHTEGFEAHDGIGVCRHTQLIPRIYRLSYNINDDGSEVKVSSIYARRNMTVMLVVAVISFLAIIADAYYLVTFQNR